MNELRVAPAALQELRDAPRLVMLGQGHERHAQVMMLQKLDRAPGVLAGHAGGVLQGSHGARGDVAEIPNGRGDQLESSGVR